jgi:hypothetical protein
MVFYHRVSSRYFREPEGLEKSSEKSESSIDGERCVDKDQVSRISGREITQTMINEEDGSQEP